MIEDNVFFAKVCPQCGLESPEHKFYDFDAKYTGICFKCRYRTEDVGNIFDEERGQKYIDYLEKKTREKMKDKVYIYKNKDYCLKCNRLASNCKCRRGK